jgi:hypothetical protein
MTRRPIAILAAAVALIPACTPTATVTKSETPTTSATTTTTVAPPAPTPIARVVNWFDLDVGDCLADPPPTDPNVIAVAVVDCTTPHHAEVYLRVPLAVNTAVVDVAGAKCNDGFTAYTGELVGSGTFTVTYLIDSNQNRTESNPDPSTAICLLQAADGGALTVPARR